MEHFTLTSNQIREIELWIDSKEYTYTINDVLEEYKKYKDCYYVSYSFKQCFIAFEHIFVR
jgi:hypothetical protein